MTEAAFRPLYPETGRPAKPVRLMLGLPTINLLYNPSDQETVDMWEANPAWQQFRGSLCFLNAAPREASDLTHTRNRFGPGAGMIQKESVRTFGDRLTDDEVVVYATVQEKDMTFPTDEKLASRGMKRRRKLAKENNAKLRESYVHKEKRLGDEVRLAHGKSKEKPRAMKKPRSMAGRLQRDPSRKPLKNTGTG